MIFKSNNSELVEKSKKALKNNMSYGKYVQKETLNHAPSVAEILAQRRKNGEKFLSQYEKQKKREQNKK